MSYLSKLGHFNPLRPEFFGVRKLDFRCYDAASSRTPTCDEQTDRRTQGHAEHISRRHCVER